MPKLIHLAMAFALYLVVTSKPEVARQKVNVWDGQECLPGDTGARCTGREGAQLAAMKNNCDMATGQNCDLGGGDSARLQNARSVFSASGNVANFVQSSDVRVADSTRQTVRSATASVFRS